MGVKYEIKAKVGEANGKAIYAKIGVVLEGDKGFNMRLNVIPMNWDGFAFFSEPEQRGNGGGNYSRGGGQARGGGGNYQGNYHASGSRNGDPGMDDDVPF